MIEEMLLWRGEGEGRDGWSRNGNAKKKAECMFWVMRNGITGVEAIGSSSMV